MHTAADLENSLSCLSEELEALGIEPVTTNSSTSGDALLNVSSMLIDVSWRLIHKYRSQIRKYEQLDDVHCKILSDNRILKSRVQTLSKDLEKQQHNLSQALEKERRSRTEAEKLGQQVKRLNTETVKLKKQLQSEKEQHQHKLQQIIRSEEKHRDRLEKSIGVRGTKKEEKTRANHDEGRSNIYEATICRLEENNSAMLREISYLREALNLCSMEDTPNDRTFLPT